MWTDKELRYHRFYMDVAWRAAGLSFATRRKVGAVAVDDCNIIAFGFNGTPAGHPNQCEDKDGNTLPSVIHAEDNLVRKLRNLRGGIPHRFDVYVTKEPCRVCASLLRDLNPCIDRVFYADTSVRNPGEGLAILHSNRINTYQIEYDPLLHN